MTECTIRGHRVSVYHTRIDFVKTFVLKLDSVACFNTILGKERELFLW